MTNLVLCCVEMAILLFLQGLLFCGLLGSSQSTSFVFNDFSSLANLSSVDQSDVYSKNSAILLNGDGVLNKTGGDCGKVLYSNKVRMKNDLTGMVASFNTSFTFAITTVNASAPFWDHGDGFAFFFGTEDIFRLPSQGSGEELCIINYGNGNTSNHLFAVEFDTFQNVNVNDPSNSHIGVDVNSVISNFTYNLCQDASDTYCSMLYNGGRFTAWIDYNSPMQTLDVHFANESQQPARVIHLPYLNLSTVFNEYMYVGFAGSTGDAKEYHWIDSWSFNSYFPIEITPVPSPSPAPTPGSAPSPSPAPAPLGQPLSSPMSSTATSNSKSMLIMSIILGVCAFFTLLCVVVYCRFKPKNSNRQLYRNRGILTINQFMGPRMFTYQELSKATKNFSESEILGSGGFGAVYKGTLQPAGTMVAVKRCIKPDSQRATDGFVVEATSISQIRHRNLMQLEGWCHEKEGLLLVYDYMPNKSLDKWIFNESREEDPGDSSKPANVLSWDLRYNILAGVAAALTYLHEEWQQCVLHRDIKSSNVMLDANFNAHLGDFGLARLIDHKKMEKTTMMAGTLGYMAPEMPYTGKATKETDVYSFGVLVLEVVCGRRALDVHQPKPEDVVLVECVWRAHEAGSLLHIVDPNIEIKSFDSTISGNNNSGEIGLNLLNGASGDTDQPLLMSSTSSSIKDLLRLGLLCCQPNPNARPSMGLVNRMFQSRDMAMLPPLPATRPMMPYALELSCHAAFEPLSYSSSAMSLSPTSSSISTMTNSSQNHFICANK